MRALVLCAALALLLPLPAQAGSSDDPEVIDPVGDGEASTAQAQGERDLVKVWVDDALVDTGEAGPGLRLNVATSEDFDHVGGLHLASERIRIGFVPSSGLPSGKVEAYAYIRPSVGTTEDSGDETVSCRFGFAATAGGVGDLIQDETAVAATFAGNLFTCEVPLSLLPGFAAGSRIDGLYAVFDLMTRGPVSGPVGGGQPEQESLPPTTLQTYDRAPDSGTGRSWTLPQPPPPPPGPVRANLTGASITLGSEFVNATTRTYLYSWDSPAADLRLRYAANVDNGTVAVRIADAGNATLASGRLDATGNATERLSGASGSLVVQVDYTGFRGRFSLSLEPLPAAAPPGTATTGATSASTTASGTGTPDKGTPGASPLLAAGCMALAALALRRRQAKA